MLSQSHLQRQVHLLPAGASTSELLHHHEAFSRRRHAFIQHREAVAKHYEALTTQRIPRRSSLQRYEY